MEDYRSEATEAAVRAIAQLAGVLNRPNHDLSTRESREHAVEAAMSALEEAVERICEDIDRRKAGL